MKDEGERILLAHGGGGVLMRELIERIASELGGEGGGVLGDSTVIDLDGTRVAFTTDSFVVSPLFFPGGDIGKLSVFGTINDLAVSGARPVAISLALIIEEGFPRDSLERIISSIKEASRETGVPVVTGDTKVVERGKADGLYINTSGIGIVPDGVDIGTDKARPGDAVIINGNIGEHGLAIMSRRKGIDFGADIMSDCAPLSEIILPIVEEGYKVRGMRDATRGGLAAVLNEIAVDSQVGIELEEEKIPVSQTVLSGCELMGYDPLNIANEGKFVVVVDGTDAPDLLSFMRNYPLGRNSAIIGRVVEEHRGKVVMETTFGGRRVVDVPYGDQLPRIC